MASSATTSHVWFPREHLSMHWRNRRGWLVGFNVSGLRTNVITVVDADSISLLELRVLLETLGSHVYTSRLRIYCKDKPPQILGVLNQDAMVTKSAHDVVEDNGFSQHRARAYSDSNRDAVLLSQQKANIWINLEFDFDNMLCIQQENYPRPLITSTYCVGFPQNAPTEIITYDSVNARKLHFLARNDEDVRREVDLELNYLRSLKYGRKNTRRSPRKSSSKRKKRNKKNRSKAQIQVKNSPPAAQTVLHHAESRSIEARHTLHHSANEQQGRHNRCGHDGRHPNNRRIHSQQHHPKKIGSMALPQQQQYYKNTSTQKHDFNQIDVAKSGSPSRSSASVAHLSRGARLRAISPNQRHKRQIESTMDIKISRDDNPNKLASDMDYNPSEMTSDLDYTLRQINAGSVFIQILFPLIGVLQHKMEESDNIVKDCGERNDMFEEERCVFVENIVRRELDDLAESSLQQLNTGGSSSSSSSSSSSERSGDMQDFYRNVSRKGVSYHHQMHYQSDEQNHSGSAKCACCRFWLQPILVLIIFLRSLAPGLIYLLTEPIVPPNVPILGGKSLTQISFLARALNTRVHVLCWLPIELTALHEPFPIAAEKKQTESGFRAAQGKRIGAVLPPDARVRRHVAVYSTLCLLVVDVALGLLLGGFCILHSSRSDIILTHLHRFAEILHMDVLTSWTVWLMGVPIGFKLNSGLASFLGAFVLTILKLWNMFTSVAAPIEGAILVTIACSGALGITTFLATLLDLLRFVVPHVWLIYTAFAKLHAVLVYVLQSLWYLFRGEKRNVLRSRVDTFEMTLDQQLVGTILFAIVSFLFITPFVFYTFWAGVWMCALVTQSLMWMALSFICTAPFYEIWILLFSQAGGKQKGPGMLPGSIRFTVTQVIRDEDEGEQNEQDEDGANERLRAQTVSPLANMVNSSILTSPSTKENNDTLYLHLTGDPVNVGKLFTATKQYIQYCFSQNSLGLLATCFLTGQLVTPLTVNHPNIDHHLHRSEALSRDDTLPGMGVLWNALQRLTMHYFQDPRGSSEEHSESDSEFDSE